ncbi:DUF4286 family protein [Bordetella bronchiseptica]|uniref:DUF4286 family protein n=1 Tax=Bordetella bronchiseptica TaxID=518 RepID=UPI0004618B3B|nr:DUF4286 family protein [Bordetella bronchiseptica]KDC63308.1 hypothetical protein L511_0590 [Bordetella bronchiseptica MBORD595]KDC75279.1 hypothetical protein L513_0569 [Bordetella bronchiseptica MBORD632]VEF45444.1 Uncharacterised protein [Bordetella bronchiseptica]
MNSKGFLMVTMEPPSAMEEEFNEWYDTEHLPERAAVDGFETARRYVCLDGFPRYMAAYDLSSPAVLEAESYRNMAGERFSPWSQRILRKAKGLWRVTGEQVYPGQARACEAPRLLLLHYRGVPQAAAARLVDELRATYEPHAQVSQLRVIRYQSGAGEPPGHVALIEGKGSLGALRGPALEGENGRCIVVANEYARYWAYAPNPVLGKVLDD